MAITKLALGTGGNTQHWKRQGFITLDADPLNYADYICEVPPLPKLPLMDVVEAYHFWEHLYWWQAEELAREIYAILKGGGKLVLELPNLRKCCEFVAGMKPIPVKDTAEYHPDPRFTLWGIYGAQNAPKWTGNIWQVHKWGYTPEDLVDQLQRAGFSKVTVLPPVFGQPERDMRVEAIK